MSPPMFVEYFFISRLGLKDILSSNIYALIKAMRLQATIHPKYLCSSEDQKWSCILLTITIPAIEITMKY